MLICLSRSNSLSAQDKSETLAIEKKKYTTTRVDGDLKIDGMLNDAAWNKVSWAGDFTQFAPQEGKLPSVPTSFKILYDNNFLYVGYRCTDPEPDSIIKRMSRRDGFPGDWVEIHLDSYHDKRTAFSFTISVSGVRGDEYISNNGNYDEAWNPIWWGKTNMDSLGWTAEVQIPLSQLRFDNASDKVWGLQVMRRLFRKEERSTWQYIPQSAGGWVSEFGELHGLQDISARKQLEIAPYIVAKSENYKPESSNPFATGRDHKLTLGLDGKMGVTNDLILDFTINPDFGQIEADPSQVRIDGFQNFFEERRPFFIESNSIFDFQLTGSEAGGDYDSDLLFYSRRIGSSPHGYPDLKSNEFTRIPQNTPILGAAKFSGKTKNGWSIGLIESITKDVYAEIDDSGERRRELIEPLTNYAVTRIQKDYNQGKTIIGAILTGVNRESNLNHQLHDAAYTGGIDAVHFWKNRTWYLRGNFVWSHVRGSKEKIYETQTSFEHLFQRSNASETEVDADRIHLTGTGNTVRFGKIGGNRSKNGQILKFETGFTLRSPELELNDLGFMLTANEINHFTWAGVQWQKQIGIFRQARINYNHWARWDYGGQFLYNAFNTNTHANFTNNWRIGSGLTWNTFDVSNNALRGGSSLRRQPGFSNFAYLNTDQRKKIVFFVNSFQAWAYQKAVRLQNYNSSIQFQPTNALSINLGVGYNSTYRKQDQFVDLVEYNNTSRVIISEVKQKTMRYTLRMNYNITPDLTIQYYGQPFITRPIYTNFGYVSDPLHPEFKDRFSVFAPTQITYQQGSYSIDENQDGQVDYSFEDPNFNFIQFRSNLVARWEYRPGSELFLVWSQSNTPDVSGDLNTGLNSSLFSNLVEEGARNILLLKATYRFVR